MYLFDAIGGLRVCVVWFQVEGSLWDARGPEESRPGGGELKNIRRRRAEHTGYVFMFISLFFLPIFDLFKCIFLHDDRGMMMIPYQAQADKRL